MRDAAVVAEKSEGGTGGVAIEVTGMSLSYQGQPAVRELDLAVEPGELLVLLGPSGCGKSSTMRSIVGLEKPDSGRITLGGKPVFDASRGINLAPNKREIGMVFQSYAIWPHMTVAENVAFPLRMRHVDKAEIATRIDETLEMVGLGGYGGRGASLLSGGQMQRVALARSVIMRPQVLLLDEPLSNLDAKLRERLRMELKELQSSLGLTSIYVTHDQQEALGLADRLAIMREGQIEQIGDPVELYERPNSSFVAEFLGVTNRFEADVRGADGNAVEAVCPATGWTVRSSDPAAVKSGRALLCVRPEAITLTEGSGPGGGPNRWDGEVEVMSFMGSYIRYRVVVAGGQRLDVVAPPSPAPHRAGAKVRVELPEREAMVLTAEPLETGSD